MLVYDRTFLILDNMYTKRLLFFLGILLGSSVLCCGKDIVLSNSGWKTNETFQKNPSGNDEKTGITWWLANDNQNLYIKFEVKNREMQMALMHDGFTLFFDTINHKNRNNSIVFSMKHEPMSKPNDIDFPQNGSLPPSPQMSGIYNQVVWQSLIIDLEMEKSDFSAHFSVDSLHHFSCEAVVPLKAINAKGLRYIHNLSIGIQIASQSGKNMAAQGGQRPPQGGGMDGRSNGMRGGVGQPGMGNGMQGPPPGDDSMPPKAPSETKPSTTKLALVWFRTEFALKPE